MSRTAKTVLAAAPIAAILTIAVSIYSLLRFIEKIDGDIAQFSDDEDDIDYTAFAEDWGIWF